MVTGIPPPFPSGFTISTYGLTAWHAVHTAYAVHLCTEKEAKGSQMITHAHSSISHQTVQDVRAVVTSLESKNQFFSFTKIIAPKNWQFKFSAGRNKCTHTLSQTAHKERVHFESAVFLVFPVGGGQTRQSWHSQSQSARGNGAPHGMFMAGPAGGRESEGCVCVYIYMHVWVAWGVMEGWFCILNSTTSVQ